MRDYIPKKYLLQKPIVFFCIKEYCKITWRIRVENNEFKFRPFLFVVAHVINGACATQLLK